ncbi:hypothetical protein ACJX0J_024400, partial [Zea mays]
MANCFFWINCRDHNNCVYGRRSVAIHEPNYRLMDRYELVTNNILGNFQINPKINLQEIGGDPNRRQCYFFLTRLLSSWLHSPIYSEASNRKDPLHIQCSSYPFLEEIGILVLVIIHFEARTGHILHCNYQMNLLYAYYGHICFLLLPLFFMHQLHDIS